jgi:outer membrane protein assembly factor BamB
MDSKPQPPGLSGCHRAGILLLMVFSTVYAADPQAVDEWTRFRGANGSGLAPATDLPKQWTNEDVRWKTVLPGRGHSSPVVWNGQVFVTAAEPDTGKRHVLGLDATSGAIRWTRTSDGPTFRQHADNSFASATPAVDADRVYVSWLAPERSVLEALDHAGKPLWSVDLGAFVAQHGAGASPTRIADLVVLPFEQDGPGESFVLAVDAATGKERWRLPRTSGKLACSTPCLYQPTEGAACLVFTSTNHGVYAVDPITGKELWALTNAFTQRCVASPVSANGLVFASDGQGGKGTRLIAVRAPAKAGEQPTIVWQMITGAPYVPCVTARGELLFVVTDGGQAACLRAATGEELWRQPLGLGTFYGSPIVVGERVYVVSRRGEVACFGATATFERLGTSALGEGAFSTPAVAGGRMFIHTFTAVTAVGAK